MHQLRKVVWTAAIALAVFSGSAQAGRFTEIVAFGDSTLDTGNVEILQCADPALPAPLSPCTSAYFDGNLSNGRNWVEFLARWLRVPKPAPFLAGGTNYAHAGAKTAATDNLRVNLETLRPIPGTEVPGVLKQLGIYLQTQGTFDGRQLVVIWGGANDLRDAQGAGDLGLIVQNLATAIITAACSGAEHIVVPNQLNASRAPAITARDPGDGSFIAAVEAAVVALNTALSGVVSSLSSGPIPPCGATPNIYFLDVFSGGEALIALSNWLGFPYANTQDPAVDLTTLEFRADVGNPNEFLFVDSIHVSTPAQRTLAAIAFGALRRR